VTPPQAGTRQASSANSAEKLIGSRQIFRQETLITTEAIDENELYCHDSVTQHSLPLLPFARMIAAPDTEGI
jgi:hypothetical protein